MPPDQPSSAALPVLLMRARGHVLAVRQRDVSEILPLPRLASLPEAPPIVTGCFHLAGELVLVLALGDLLGLPGAAEGNPLYHHLLLLPDRPDHPRRALLVDRVLDLVVAEPELLPAGESFNDCVEGEIRVEAALVPLVSAARLLTAFEASRLAAFATRAAARNAAFAAAPVAAAPVDIAPVEAGGAA